MRGQQVCVTIASSWFGLRSSGAANPPRRRSDQDGAFVFLMTWYECLGAVLIVALVGALVAWRASRNNPSW